MLSACVLERELVDGPPAACVLRQPPSDEQTWNGCNLLFLPLDKFHHGKVSRLPGAVIKNAGGGKQKHWATSWVVDRKAKYTNARNEVRRCRRLPSPKTNGSKPTAPRSPPHCSPREHVEIKKCIYMHTVGHKTDTQC